MRILLPALIVAGLLAGCARTSDKAASDKDSAANEGARTEAPASESPGPARLEAPAVATLEGDHQVVHVTVSDRGYKPASVQLKAGVPARIVFKQTTDSMCLSQVQIPDFNVPPTDLPVNQETTVEFTPGQSGNYTFTCGMNMAKGTIIVAS